MQRSADSRRSGRGKSPAAPMIGLALACTVALMALSAIPRPAPPPAAEAANDAPPLADPPPPPPPGFSGCDRGFVRLLYQAVLGRPADPAGEALWTGLLQSGVTRIDVARAVLGFAEADARLVQEVYQLYLLRPADPVGLASGTSVLQGGLPESQYRASILGSTEYFLGRAGGDESAFIDQLYQDVLGRPVDPAGLAFWLPQVQGGAPRTTVAAAVLTSNEGRLRFIDLLAQLYLGRPSDPALRAAYLSAFQSGATEDDVRASILASPESVARSSWTDCHLLSAVTSGAGTGDLVLNGVPSAAVPAAVQGWLLVTFDTVQPVGAGPLLGLAPDSLTLAVIDLPGTTGGLFHWLVSPNGFPNQSVSFAPGTLSFLAGLSADLLQVDVDPTPAIANASNIVRVTF